MAEGVISRRGSEFASVGLKRTVGVRRGFNVGQGEPVQINTLIQSRGNIETALPTSISATSTLFSIPLDDTRILFIYTTGGSGVSNPSAVVLTYTKSNNTTTIGPTNTLHTLLNSFVSMSNTDWGRQFSAVKLNDGRILLSFVGLPSPGSFWRTMYAILSISGTTITMSGAGILNNTLSADTFDGLSSSQVVDNNRVLWLYRGGTPSISNRPVASVLTISGNVVTTSGTNFVLDSVSTNTGVNLEPIEGGRFLATFCNSSNHATILVLLVTNPDIITMGTTFIPVTNTVTHSSNKVGVAYPNIGILVFPSSTAGTNQIFRYRIEGANLTFLNQSSFSTVNSNNELMRVSQKIFVSVLRNGNILISNSNTTGTSNISYNLVWFDANLNNLNNTSPSSSSVSSSQIYTIVNTVLSQDYLLFWRNYGTSTSTLASRVEVYHNAAFSVQPVDNFNTSTRIAFTTHAATSEQDVDIIVPPTSSQNPFNVI
jgi:hypothetical protein